MTLSFLCCLPMLKLIFFGRTEKLRNFTQDAVRLGFVLTLKFLKILHVVELKADLGSIDVNTPHILVCNHISMFDYLAVLSHFPRCYTFVKKKVLRNPLLAPIVKACGFIPLDPDSPADRLEAYQRASALIDSGNTFVAWPEGTRSKTGELGAFQPGIFKIAMNLSRDITPVFFSSNFPIFNNTEVFRIFPERICYRMRIGGAIPVPKVVSQNPLEARKAVRSFCSVVQDIFHRWTQTGEINVSDK